jgi:hypothetical protein
LRIKKSKPVFQSPEWTVGAPGSRRSLALPWDHSAVSTWLAPQTKSEYIVIAAIERNESPP